MPMPSARRSPRPIALPGTAGVVVAVLLATCAVVAAEAQWRQREHRMRDGHPSSLVMGQFSSCLALADRGLDHPQEDSAEVRGSGPGRTAGPRSGDRGFGGTLAALRLRGLLNTPPPRV